MLAIILMCCLTIDEICSLIGALTASITAFIGICKYNDYVRRGHIQYLLEFGNKYTKDPDITEVILFLEKLEDDNMYRKEFLTSNNTYTEEALTLHSLEMFMRFIEELELLIRGGAISESAALNLFGHYTTVLDKYNKRWPNLKYDEEYWNVYRSFVEKAKKFNYNSVMI